MIKQLGSEASDKGSENVSKSDILGFWTSRGDSAIWDERVVRAEEMGARRVGLRRTKAESANCGADGGACGVDQGGGCGGGCGGCGGGEG